MNEKTNPAAVEARHPRQIHNHIIRPVSSSDHLCTATAHAVTIQLKIDIDKHPAATFAAKSKRRG